MASPSVAEQLARIIDRQIAETKLLLSPRLLTAAPLRPSFTHNVEIWNTISYRKRFIDGTSTLNTYTIKLFGEVCLEPGDWLGQRNNLSLLHRPMRRRKTYDRHATKLWAIR
jgi:hypothetical protein